MAEFNVKGLADLQKLLNELPAKVERNVMRGALRAGANVIKDEAKRSINSHSGELAKSLKVSARARGGRVTASVRPKGKNAYIARFVEYGTRPHKIRAKNGGLLLGNEFVSEVDHPGARPHPFLRPALDSQAKEATVAVGNYIKKRLATKHGMNTADINIEADE